MMLKGPESLERSCQGQILGCSQSSFIFTTNWFGKRWQALHYYYFLVQSHDQLLLIYVPKLWLFDYSWEIIIYFCGETEAMEGPAMYLSLPLTEANKLLVRTLCH